MLSTHSLFRSGAASRNSRYFSTNTAQLAKDTLKQLGVAEFGSDGSKPIPGVFDGLQWKASGDVIETVNPSTNTPLAKVQLASKEDLERCLTNIHAAKKVWAAIPAPKRGDIVREIGEALRKNLQPLGALVSLEMGKARAEGVGEVQEYVDICDYATGLSRMMSGQVLPSERQDHTLLEVYNPRGAIGIITAFNFPCAVFGWNSAISMVCGNTQIVKGAESTSLVNIFTQKLLVDVLKKNKIDTRVAALCQAYGNPIGEIMISDPRINLVSFTGSTAVGKRIKSLAGDKFIPTILELGGNNAVIITNSCSPQTKESAIRAALFGAIGTCGQRCTTTRRLIVHEDVYDEVMGRLKQKYDEINNPANKKIGDPLAPGVVVGPLHRKSQVDLFQKKIKEIKEQGGKIVSGGSLVDTSKLSKEYAGGNFVQPALVELSHKAPIIFEENFVPIIYVVKYKTLEEAIALNNSVEQGLSSALFTDSMKDVFKWIGPLGSDTGIVNVNTGSSGAEIGGAFGGEKATGGGRESGSDAWKQYMRRSTCTINWGDSLPLAQGITFD